MPVKATNTRQQVTLTSQEYAKIQALSKRKNKSVGKIIHMALKKSGTI